MKDWKSSLVPPTASIADAIRAIDQGGAQICLVVDAEERLLGTVTDGDVRRGILNSTPLDAPVTVVMNEKSIVAESSDSVAVLKRLMETSMVRRLPLVDSRRRVIGLILYESIFEHQQPYDNWVVLMAGGLGTRLRPLTEDTPKPLLPVGGRPLLETILRQFIEHNFRRFVISVNYKAEMIKESFGDGKRMGLEIRYVQEDQPLGTAGPLSLVEEATGPLNSPIIVMNSDVLTKVNFMSLLDFHREQKARATMCVRECNFQVPYGVVESDGHRILAIKEKPVQSFFVNAGIYVLNPEIVRLVPDATRYDMPTLFERVVAEGEMASAFPIREYWLDVGRIPDLARATDEYDTIFDNGTGDVPASETTPINWNESKS